MTRRDDLHQILIDHQRRKRAREVRRRRRRHAGFLLAGTGLVVVLLILVLGIGTGVALSTGCSLSTLKPVVIGQNSFLYAADGSLLGSIPAERNREPVTLAQEGGWLPKATVAIEDRR